VRGRGFSAPHTVWWGCRQTRRAPLIDNEVYSVTAVRIGLQVLLVIAGLFLTLLILLHKGRGGGLSDMFGGGVSSNLGGSSIAERNLDRFTIAVAVVWFTAVVGLGLLERFAA
jgi:preprotein translocase subunit SecG